MAIKIKLRNAAKFQTELKAGILRYSKEAFQALVDETKKHSDGLVGAVEKDSRFQALKNDERVRGILGMPSPRYKIGSDTDEDDLLFALRNYDLKVSRGILNRKVSVTFPTIAELEMKLVRSLSSISVRGAVSPGPLQSWFRWWENGDQGEITSLTVLRSSVAKVAAGRKTSGGGKSLSQIITERSRSGFGLQIRSIASSTGFEGGKLIQEKYSGFSQIYPARMSKRLRQFVEKTRGKLSGFFSSTRV